MIVVTVSGNLGQDAELKYTPGGDPILSFSVASNEKKGGEKTTTWVRCSLFGKRGEALSKYMTKGTRVMVAGTGSLREYESKSQTKTSFDVRVNEVDLMGGGEPHEVKPTYTPQNAHQHTTAAKKATQQNFGEVDDELPF
jgi:single-strand DNA-binding protein